MAVGQIFVGQSAIGPVILPFFHATDPRLSRDGPGVDFINQFRP
jgi:hypothetical protein